jgi:periodic tryptophan protein 1
MASMITATAWVAYPTKYEFDEEEYERISKLAKMELEDAQEGLEEARQALDGGSGSASESKPKKADKDEDDQLDEDDDLKEYDMEHYDDDEDDIDEAGSQDGEESGLFGNVKSLAYHADNKDDPYITLQENDASDDEEREELQIMPTDNMVLAARVEDEVAHLEVYVYEDNHDNLYVHHDVMLPAIPLCVEWLAARPNEAGARGNFAAVGTMDPDIELWDLDVVDSMYPTVVLGESSQPSVPMPEKKKKKNKTKKANDAYHVDAVLSLAANRQHSNLLASASADKTVKLWDLNTCTAAHSYSHHTDKVCALSWHPTQPSVLLSGSYDRTVVAADMRAPDAKVPRWGVESDVEQVKWDPSNEHIFYVSTENGILHCFDTRQLPATPEESKPSWRLQAHEKALSSFSINPVVPGMIATGSTDRTVKLWSITDNAGPSLVASRDLGVGKVFSANFAPDREVAFRLAVAGSKGAVQVWDTSTNRAVRENFAGRAPLPAPDADVKERLVGLEPDNEEEEEEQEAAEAAQAGDNGAAWESMDED